MPSPIGITLWALIDPVGDDFRWTVGDEADKWRSVQRGAFDPAWRPRVCQYMGRPKLNDFLWSGLGSLALVSERVRAAMEVLPASGISFFGVDLEDLNGDLVPGYSAMCISGRAGVRQVRTDQVTFDGVDKTAVGIDVVADQYDGSDVCVFDDMFTMFVSSRVRQRLASLRVTGVRMIPTNELEVVLL